jgi:hypothetical protein
MLREPPRFFLRELPVLPDFIQIWPTYETDQEWLTLGRHEAKTATLSTLSIAARDRLKQFVCQGKGGGQMATLN